MKWIRNFKFWGRSPLTIIEIIIAVVSIISGLYVMSPLIALSTLLNGASPLVATIGSQVGLIIFGAIYAFSGFLGLYGVWKRQYRLRSTSLFIQICCRFYVILTIFIVDGFLPLSWINNLAVLLISTVLWFYIKKFVWVMKAHE